METFRCCSLVHYDFKYFIEIYLSELEYDQRFTSTSLSSLGNKILLLFQMLSYSLNDKLLLHSSVVNFQSVSEYLEETWAFKLDYFTLKIYLSKILEAIKSCRTKDNLHELIFSCFYSELNCTLSKF